MLVPESADGHPRLAVAVGAGATIAHARPAGRPASRRCRCPIRCTFKACAFASERNGASSQRAGWLIKGSAASSADPTSRGRGRMGSRTRRRRSIITQFIALNARWLDAAACQFASWERPAPGIRFFSSGQADRRAAMFCATCVPRRCQSSPACEARIALPPNRRCHLRKLLSPTSSNRTRLLRQLSARHM